MTERPFRILGVQQIAIGSRTKEGLLHLWVDLLGLERTGEYRNASENVDEVVLACGVGPHRVEIDLMEPIDPDGRPRVHEPALNHVGLWVDDLRRAMDWLTKEGVRFTPGGVRRGAGGHEVCFVHPKASAEFPIGGEGVLIELVQAPQEMIEGAENAAVDRVSGADDP